MLALSGAVALPLAPWLSPWTVSGLNFVVAFAAQAVKISIDSLLQTHVPDTLLGRTFSLQDMMYNAGLVAAAAMAAWSLPRSGAAVWPFFAMAATLLVVSSVLPPVWRRVSALDERAPRTPAPRADPPERQAH
jgi:hypothetical protein